MYLVVIRSDLRNPLFLSDIEPVSQTNPTTESPKGQARYVSRPNRANIQKYLNDQGLNELLKSTGWTVGSGWTGTYNSFAHTSGTTALSNSLAGVATQVYSLTVTITGRTAGTVTVTFGGGTTGAISATTTTSITASTTGNLVITPTNDFDGTVALSLKVDAAAALITATVPGYSGGLVVPTVDISATAIKTIIGLSGVSNAQVETIQNMLGYHLVETDIVKKSVLAGCIHGYLSTEFNPDSRGDLNHPPATKGQAVQVVQDVNHLSTTTSLFTVSTPIITGLTLSGSLTIAGSAGGLIGYGLYETTVIITGYGARRITQDQILAAGGTVTSTSIVVPASLIAATATVPTVPTTGKTWVRVQVNDMLSNLYAL